MKEELAVAVLRELHTVYEKYKAVYFLDQGVLLGALRDKAFIPHDTDIDFSTTYPHVKPLIQAIPELKDRGFTVRVHCNNILLVKDGIATAIACYQLMGNYYVHIDYCMGEFVRGRSQERGLELEQIYDVATHGELQTITRERLHKLANSPKFVRNIVRRWAFNRWQAKGGVNFGYIAPRHYFDKLETIQFYDMKFHIPSSPEKYIAYKYGHTWRVPDKNWDMWHDDGAIIQDFEKVAGWQTLKDLL